jgi:hypothetical protein
MRLVHDFLIGVKGGHQRKERILKSITKAEVEAAMGETTPEKVGPHAPIFVETEEDQQFAQLVFIPEPTRLAWLLVGYEIARARAERGEII